jgi:hypothetical protein
MYFHVHAPDSLQICWAHTCTTNDHKLHGLHTYHDHAPRARVQARTWFSVRLSLARLYSDLLGTCCKSPQVAWATYFSCSRTECMRASSRVFKHSLIFGRILSKFGENILQVTTNCMGYVLVISLTTLTACACACLLIFERILSNLVGTYNRSPEVTCAI